MVPCQRGYWTTVTIVTLFIPFIILMYEQPQANQMSKRTILTYFVGVAVNKIFHQTYRLQKNFSNNNNTYGLLVPK